MLVLVQEVEPTPWPESEIRTSSRSARGGQSHCPKMNDTADINNSKREKRCFMIEKDG